MAQDKAPKLASGLAVNDSNLHRSHPKFQMENVSHLSVVLCRWVLPFSRQFTTTFVSYAPIVPWTWKMALLKNYLSSKFYSASGLQHMIPAGSDMDYTGTNPCDSAIAL